MTRILCTGDLHLGVGADLLGPGERLLDQEQVWDRICTLALEENVDALLFGGDAFEGPIPTAAEYVAFARPLRRLAGEIPVLAIPGNGKHDSAGRPGANALEVFEAGYARSILDVHSRPGVWDRLDGVTVCTLPWVPVSNLVASMNGGDRDSIHVQAAELLLNVARGLRAQVDGPAILLAHWSISGASLPNGLGVEHLREPVLPVDELESQGWDAVVLGHIHKPQMLSETGRPHFYVGSPMPLNFGEANCHHGVWIIEEDPDQETAARLGPFTAQLRPVESRPFVTMDYSVEAWQEIIDGEPLALLDEPIIRARYTATGEESRRLDHAKIRQTLIDQGAAAVRIQPDIVREDRRRVEGIDETLEPLEALGMWVGTQTDVPVDVAIALKDRCRRYLEEARA